MRQTAIPITIMFLLTACDPPPGTNTSVGDPGSGPASTGGAPAGTSTDVGNPNGGPAATGPGMTIKAGPVTLVPGPGGGRGVGGSFEIRVARPGEQNLAQATNGGACLVAQVPGVSDGTCNMDSDCDVRVGSGPGQTTWRGYCLGAQNDDSQTKCWFKPSEAFCVRRLPAGAHSIPAADTSEVRQKFPRRPIKWKVYSCLNGPLTPGKTPPCAGGEGEKMHDHGPIKVVQP